MLEILALIFEVFSSKPRVLGRIGRSGKVPGNQNKIIVITWIVRKILVISENRRNILLITDNYRKQLVMTDNLRNILVIAEIRRKILLITWDNYYWAI